MSTEQGTTTDGRGVPILAGLVTAVVGFTSSFAVVLAGLVAVGATPTQAGSGLLILCLTMGAGSALFSWRLKMPITMAWSTPGAALLAASTVPEGGFGTAVSGFVVAGVLIALCGWIRPLGQLVAAIPTPLAQAMLAGVLLQLCVAPVQAAAAEPAAIVPVLVTWLILIRLAPRWAVPGALATGVVVMAVSGTFGALGGADLAPTIELVAPAWNPAGIVAIGLPLFLVTMTSQNIPGMAVLAGFGYRPALGPFLGYTGAATAVGAFGGAHAINLAAISAALSAGPEGGRDPGRRWIAGVTCGLFYLAFGPLAALVAAVSTAAPAGLMLSIAGLALIGTFAGSAAAALAREDTRVAAAITFLVAASGLGIGGIGAAFWALVFGGGYLLLTTWTPGRRSPSDRGTGEGRPGR